jgi:predicted AlkP superfamily pyrophosphatase or phosphodiesterase
LALASSYSFAVTKASSKPRLVLAVIVDQFRYDYLTRFRSEYHGGFDQMLTRGADFTNAFYGQVPTVTAVGHSIFMSGAMPAQSGIITNAWYDRDERKIVTSVCDWSETEVGGGEPEKGKSCTDADPASPRRLLVSTLGDELRMARTNSKVIGISIKARAAILPSGHLAEGAFWFDDASGHFITSTYYMKQLPQWATAFNAKDLPAGLVKQKWDKFPSWNFMASPGSREPYAKIAASPWGNELIEQFAEAAVDGAQLGQRPDGTDLLTVSFSSNDYVGHRVGPDAPEVEDMAIRTDQQLAKLFRHLDQKIGLANVLVVLSADHGAATAPSHAAELRMPGGYISEEPSAIVTTALNKAFGEAEWTLHGGGETALYFNRDAISAAKTPDGKALSMDQVYEIAKDALMGNLKLHVARVYTRTQLENGVSGDVIAQAEMNGFFPRRSGDMMIVYESGYVPGTSGTSHFSPYSYDRHVPVVFMGPGIKPGRYDMTIAPNDIAPTIATMLDVQTPSGSSGRVLSEMLGR